MARSMSEQELFMAGVQTAIHLKLQARRRKTDDSPGAEAQDLAACTSSYPRKQRQAVLRRVVAELVHAPADVDELEAMELDLKLEEDDGHLEQLAGQLGRFDPAEPEEGQTSG